MKNKKRLYIIIALVALAVLIVVGSTYAFWRVNKSQTDDDIILTKCLSLDFTNENNAIYLKDAEPILDSDGVELQPFTFDIVNNCSTPVNYELSLETIGEQLNSLGLDALKIQLDSDEPAMINSYSTAEKTLNNAWDARYLYSGTVGGNDTDSHSLKIWLDENASVENISTSSNKKSYEGKITLTYGQLSIRQSTLQIGSEFNKNLKVLSGDVDSDHLAYNTSIEKVEFLNIGEIPAGYNKNDFNALPSVNLSEDSKSKITAYWDEGNKTIYIYSNYKIMFNYDSEMMFLRFSNLKSIIFNNIDTSNVDSFDSLFAFCKSLTDVDLSSFDTSNATDIQYLFYECNGLQSVDLSSFDTSNVIYMIDMFYACRSLTTLDLSNFDTSKVTDMRNMFGQCTNLSKVNLANFKTSSETSMMGMFADDSMLVCIYAKDFEYDETTTNMFRDVTVRPSATNCYN